MRNASLSSSKTFPRAHDQILWMAAGTDSSPWAATHGRSKRSTGELCMQTPWTELPAAPVSKSPNSGRLTRTRGLGYSISSASRQHMTWALHCMIIPGWCKPQPGHKLFSHQNWLNPGGSWYSRTHSPFSSFGRVQRFWLTCAYEPGS